VIPAVDLASARQGCYSEVKYDGERVQIHKDGDSYTFYSRNLKSVKPDKVAEVKDHVPAAFGDRAENMILDAEILLVDRTKSGREAMLPFGTLGTHKKTGFSEANPCLFIFDILWHNGKSLQDTPLKERRELLERIMTPVEYRVQLSEQTLLTDSAQLTEQMEMVLDEGLEGLVLKDVGGTYSPGGRYWLKIKRDYLMKGAMADTADLVVLGANLGTGKKGGVRSVFLMGVLDGGTWRTVCKVGNGFTDARLAQLQSEIPMVKCGSAPKWLDVSKSLMPDFVVQDPRKSPVWEITGAEFSESSNHTAVDGAGQGISIRFPRVTRERDDKDAASATTLAELVHLRDISGSGATGSGGLAKKKPAAGT